MDLTPPTLTGRFITLEPLEERHAPGLFEVMRDEEVYYSILDTEWPEVKRRLAARLGANDGA